MPPARAVFALLLAYAAFVVYGSLVPLDVHPLPLAEAWRRFEAMPFLQLGVESRADWIANGVLYLPLGFLAAWWLLRCNWWQGAALLAAVAVGVALALGVEFAQVFFPPRTVSLNDVMAECIGTLLGASLALVVHRRGRSVAAVRQVAGSWLEAHGFQVYAAAYLAFSLFPYDLLISGAEFARKLDSDLWGWWIAGQGGRPLIVALQLGIEAALTAPLGVWVGRRRAGRRAPSYGRAALVGLTLGLGIELAQLLIASGVSQGASVLARGVGTVAGLALWQRRERASIEGLRTAIASTSRLWVPAYALLLIAVNGWFTYAWLGVDAVGDKLHSLRFLPFYYHYYTSEMRALSSGASVLLMYLPVGVLAWAWRRPAGAAALWGLAVCGVIEASKLWLAGQHPDPTNLWIAAAACWAFVKAADRWPLRAALPAGIARVDASARAEPAATWLRPLAVIVIAPALLPALDLAPWTGRFFWDEFDLLLAVCLAVGYLRAPPARRGWTAGPWRPAFALLALSFAVSTVIGAMPWPWPDAGSFASYYSPYNALRIAKGVFWAWLFVGLLLRLQQGGHDSRAALATGMTLGLAYVVTFVVWERLAFVGLFDFADEYRVTGPFSAMHRGGAFIEGYIAVAMPFAALRVMEARHWLARAAGTLLLVGASYAMMVTFSRSGYAAFGVALVLFFAVSLARGRGSPRQAWLGGLVVVAMLAVAAAVLLGSFAQERLARWGQDLSVRQAHWNDALNMRDPGPWTAAFGMGVGRFPETHFWRSREPAHAGSYSLESDGDVRYLRLGGAGGGLYIDQIVGTGATEPLVLKLRLRANRPAAHLEVSLCEKWMLTSRACSAASIRSGDVAGTWTSVAATLADIRPTAPQTRWPRPVKLALHTPAAGTVVDVTELRLLTSDGRDLLSNGDFRHGLGHWYFSTDIDPPWHIHSLPLAVLFDQGWFGLVAWALLLATAAYRGARKAWRGDQHAAAALAALVAFLIVGSLNTLIDEPRFLFLLLVVTALCCVPRNAMPRTTARTA